MTRVMILSAAMLSLAVLAAPAWAAGDAAAGKTVFARCGLCHSAEAGRTKIGPTLYGVVGRASGSVDGYNYSTAMKAYNKVWTPENLDVYLTGPMKVVPGTKMAFAGVAVDSDRQNLIAYLETLK